jgi:serine phosphatase RsbU (regulator of sigma subunit)/DNA-binding response OmpR family regulator
MEDTQRSTSRADILVVDDTPANLRLLADLLGNQGYKVRPTNSGARALAAIQTELPDVILLDVRMSGMDGYALCTTLKNDPRTRDVPVIFISALDETLDKVKAFAVGGADYITKPFQFDEVLARIETHVNIRRLYQQLQRQNEQLQQENTARSILAERLERGNALLKAQHEAAIDGILVVDEQQCISYYNHKFVELWNVPADILERKDEQALHEYMLPQHDDPVAMVQMLAYLATNNNEIRRDELRLRDGRIIDQHTAPIMSPGGDYLGRVWHYRDITRRTQIELELKRAYEHVTVLNTRLQDELVLARDVQQRLLSPPKPEWSSLDVVCYTHPAHEVGGDFYDYFAFNQPGKYGIALGDVSGKGMPAALLMAVSLAALQISVKDSTTPADLLGSLDTTIMRYTLTSQQNCALMYLEIDLGTQRVSVANAGGISPLIKDANGSLAWIDVGGLPLGVGMGATAGYQQQQVQLGTGDMLILVSDGVVEARNPQAELLGFERFEQLVAAAPHTNATAMLDYLTSNVMDYVGETELYDDMTMIVVKL